MCSRGNLPTTQTGGHKPSWDGSQNFEQHALNNASDNEELEKEQVEVEPEGTIRQVQTQRTQDKHTKNTGK